MRASPLFALVLLAACQATPAPAPPTTLGVPAARYDLAMNAAAAALRERGFVIERFDARMGVVAAHPEGIPSSGEWWKGNNANFSDWEARANLQDLRHRPCITLTPADAEKSGYTLAVEVTVERLDAPTRHVTAAFGAPAANLSEVPEHWQARGVQNNLWQPIGRDAQLEKKLARDIEKKMR